MRKGALILIGFMVYLLMPLRVFSQPMSYSQTIDGGITYNVYDDDIFHENQFDTYHKCYYQNIIYDSSGPGYRKVIVTYYENVKDSAEINQKPDGIKTCGFNSHKESTFIVTTDKKGIVIDSSETTYNNNFLPIYSVGHWRLENEKTTRFSETLYSYDDKKRCIYVYSHWIRNGGMVARIFKEHLNYNKNTVQHIDTCITSEDNHADTAVSLTIRDSSGESRDSVLHGSSSNLFESGLNVYNNYSPLPPNKDKDSPQNPIPKPQHLVITKLGNNLTKVFYYSPEGRIKKQVYCWSKEYNSKKLKKPFYKIATYEYK